MSLHVGGSFTGAVGAHASRFARRRNAADGTSAGGSRFAAQIGRPAAALPCAPGAIAFLAVRGDRPDEPQAKRPARRSGGRNRGRSRPAYPSLCFGFVDVADNAIALACAPHSGQREQPPSECPQRSQRPRTRRWRRRVAPTRNHVAAARPPHSAVSASSPGHSGRSGSARQSFGTEYVGMPAHVQSSRATSTGGGGLKLSRDHVPQ